MSLTDHLSPHCGPEDPSGFQSSLYLCFSIHPSLFISVYMSGCPSIFLAIIHASRKCAQRMRLQATRSNPLSASIICPSVCLSSCPRSFFNFCICINFQSGIPMSQFFLSTLFIIYFFKHLIWNQLSTTTATAVAPVINDNRKSLFVLFLSLIQSYYYGVTYIRLTSFVSSMVFLKKISTGFLAIITNKVDLFFVFDKKLFLQFDCFIF